MNSKKGKNKKPNRPPNLNPPQKVDNPEIQEKIEDLKEKPVDSEIKDDERVPEIVSEVILTPSVEIRGQDVDTPKKPKRNRNKKKKQDKEDIANDCQDDKASEPLKSETNVEIIEVPEEALLEAASVLPSVRKKKNKKKGDENITEKPILQEREVHTGFLNEEKKTETDIINTDPVTSKINTTEEQEIKHSKKKNKKKKQRNDSEKSDKIEETSSCTTVSHNLLDEEKEKPLKLEDQTEPDNTQLISKESMAGTEPKGDYVKEKDNSMESTDIISLSVELAMPKEDVKETYVTESKDKKKNKKEKKQIPKPADFQIQKTDDLHTQYENVVEEKDEKPCQSLLSSDMVPQTDTTKESKEKVELEFHNIKEKSPKPKAKIAKPVDKKRKDKEDIQVDDTLENIDSSEAILTPLMQTEKNMYISPQIASAGSGMTDAKDELKERSESLKDVDILTGNIEGTNIIKSLNTTELNEFTIEVGEIINPLEQIASVPIQALSEQEIIKDEIIFESLESSDIATKPIRDKLDYILDETQTYDIKRSEVPTDVTKLLEDGRSKQEKKKKKSPKGLAVSEVKSQSLLQENIRSEEISQEYKAFKDHTSGLDLPSTDDIDIRVDKPEPSENLPCGIMPDVLYPRSISQQNLDDNNNMVIQEILVEDIINIPVVLPSIPLVEGSGETPIGTPEMIASGIRITEIETVTSVKEEKTDLKSKMMEVNKDMEELRLSIERSLAEFTSMEKSEAAIEKQFEQKVNLTIEDKSAKLIQDPTLQSLQQEAIPDFTNQSTESKIETLISNNSEISSEINQTNTTTAIVEEDNIHKKTITDQNIDELVTTTEQEEPCEILTIKDVSQKETHNVDSSTVVDVSPPTIPARKDHKGKGKKRKGRQEVNQSVTATQSVVSSETKDSSQDVKKEEKSKEKSETTEEKGKQQSSTVVENLSNTPADEETLLVGNVDYEPIDNFEDALTSSADDVNETFEMMVTEVLEKSQQKLAANKPEINIIAPVEDTEQNQDKVHPVSQPKNLLGHPNIPVRSNKTDYKKEKNKTPNTSQAKVKIKDAVDVETQKQSKESQTENRKAKNNLNKMNESFLQDNENDDFVYKYSFRKVFLQSSCHICKKELKRLRVPCNFCNLVFYCSAKHKDEDWPNHQALCFAVSTIVHVKDQKYIYADAKGITGHNYRLLRMQMILSCEKVLKRRLVPWEQESLLYPRVCADIWCREWRQSKLKDCDSCGQISYCTTNPDHLPKSHQRWCKSYSLYQKLVTHQQTKGRLEPKLPSKVMSGQYVMPEKINEVLASIYQEKIDMNDIQYAALTQIATAPLTAAFCHQIYRNKVTSPTNGIAKKTSCTIHVVGVELQFEADVLNKWEVFFLHLKPDVEELTVVLIGTNLNPGNLPLELLGRIKLCHNCRQNKRRVKFSFQDKTTYQEYRSSEAFIHPDLVCAFNPSIQRASVYNGSDPWPATVCVITKLKIPLLVTAQTVTELQRDLMRIKECADDVKVIVDPKYNSFASVRPDRNFISDDEMPLLFKNYCFMMLTGV